MSIPFKLEEFGAASQASDKAQAGNQETHMILASDMESKRLEGYEAGYRAGWDDATAEIGNDSARIEAEFARNLADLGFTFQEARTHVLGALEPLLNTMVETVLPKLVQDALGHIVNEEIMPLAAQAADAPIQVRVSPGSRGALDQLMEKSGAVPFEILEEDTLPDGQVYLRSPTAERCIDLTSALDRIKGAVGALYDINEKAFKHG